MPSKDYLMLRSALGRVSKHATTSMQHLLALRAQFLPSLCAVPPYASLLDLNRERARAMLHASLESARQIGMRADR